MYYNFRLFGQTFYYAFFATKESASPLTRRRILFLLVFYSVWPLLTIIHWACFGIDAVLFRAYKKQEVTEPLFILSCPRSGSTFLHRLLAQDTSNFTTMKTWEIYLAPSIVQKKCIHILRKIDQILLKSCLKKAFIMFDTRLLGNIKIHPTSLLSPEEDESLLLHVWDSYFIRFLFPNNRQMPDYRHFDTALSDPHKARSMMFYKRMVQKHLYMNPGKIYISKSPSFCAKIESIQHVFPDAKLIYLMREPSDMLQSAISWTVYAKKQFMTEPDTQHVYKELLDTTVFWYQNSLRALSLTMQTQKQLIHYDDLISEPTKQVVSLYTHFGYAQPKNLAEIITRNALKASQSKTPHTSSYKALGINRRVVRRSYAPIVKLYNSQTKG